MSHWRDLCVECGQSACDCEIKAIMKHIPPEYLKDGSDYGFSSVEAVPLDQHEGLSVETEQLKSDVRALEKIIVPLLMNLIKTADNPYIHWPQRREICQRFLDQVLTITRKSA
jgi:hypothetical protein